MKPEVETQTTLSNRDKRVPVFAVGILLIILAAAAGLRLVGVNWDAGQHLHPDERFLSMVLSAIEPVKSPAEYFNTAASSLNPANRGFNFFVYGTFPIFIVRYLAEWTGQVGYDAITILGRQASAVADLLTVLVVFFVGNRLYGWKPGLTAAALYGFAVLPIQQAHFMTVDTFTNLFGSLTVLAAVYVLKYEEPKTPWLAYLVFGVCLGMAAASKVNAAALAVLLPLAQLARHLQLKERRSIDWSGYLYPLALAALVSLVTFRVLQPYAFDGLGLNTGWLQALRSLREQASGRVDFPPALQWADRPLTFSIVNTMQWGMGWAWGLTSFVSVLAAGWQVIKRKVYTHLPILGFTLLYLVWQASSWVRAMRYLLLLYPLLAILAAWGIWKLIDQNSQARGMVGEYDAQNWKLVGKAVLLLTLSLTGLWAFAFTRIYTRPHTRVAASEWIYRRIPGAIRLEGSQENGAPLRLEMPYQAPSLSAGEPLPIYLEPRETGILRQLLIPPINGISFVEAAQALSVSVKKEASASEQISSGSLGLYTLPGNQDYWAFRFDEPLTLMAGSITSAELRTTAGSTYILDGNPYIVIETFDGRESLQLQEKPGEYVSDARSNTTIFTPQTSFRLEILKINRPIWINAPQKPGAFVVTIQNGPSSVSGAAPVTSIWDGQPFDIHLDQALELSAGQPLTIKLGLAESGGVLAYRPAVLAVESTWDDGLPLNLALDGGYKTAASLYQTGLNLEAYWPDDASKRERLLNILDQTDYLVISSNRQYGTINRVPQRYPLTAAFYRNLLACPEGFDTLTCFNLAEPSGKSGNFGFQLERTFSSYPDLGPLVFNDQFAEEAFSVYDHPKVMVFKKTAAYSADNAARLLGAVDLSRVDSRAPGFLGKPMGAEKPADGLMLSEAAVLKQQSGGTWAEIFNRTTLVNRSPAAATLVFYLLTLVLSWAVFPFLWPFFGFLPDGAYPFARSFGFLLFAFIAFNLGALGIEVSRGLLALLFLTLLAIGFLAMYRQREDLLLFLQQNWKNILTAELIGLFCFTFFLYLRWLNPDLWHPYHGGEKPMDFAYLNAVIKSSTFPSYDPWFSGGYINYYYFGMVIAGMPIKLLGIDPAIAVNIVLPLWFSMIAMGAYSLGSNLSKLSLKMRLSAQRLQNWARISGILAVILVLLIGNLGTVRLLQETARTMGAQGQDPASAGYFANLGFLAKGAVMILQGEPLPLYPGTWYWNPSRTIAGSPITEFPLFTFLYADPHAHLYAMPFVLLAVAWALNTLYFEENKKLQAVKSVVYLALGGLLIGVLKPLNTWDFYTLFALGASALLYRLLSDAEDLPGLKRMKIWPHRLLVALGAISLLFIASQLLLYAFNSHFHPAFNQVAFWKDAKTTIREYLTHWGFFIFIMVWWYAWETYKWLAATRLSALQKWAPYKKQILTLLILAALIALVLGLLMGVRVAFIVIPLGLLTLALVLRPGLTKAERFAFFLAGTALLLTLFVELVYLLGDNGRQNFVFKFYLQAWFFFAIASAYGLGRLFLEQGKWRQRTQNLFYASFGVMALAVLLFPITATLDKVSNRMDRSAPHTLDGMAFMQTSRFTYPCHRNSPEAECQVVELDLGEDYRAIRWMQEQVAGSPVIIEGHGGLYSWTSRFSIYTGLPTVLGWDYHQMQQRGIMADDAVGKRARDVELFYQTTDPVTTEALIREYGVKYIVLGRYERALYFAEGVEKFKAWDGLLWDVVYQDGQTTLYKVR